MTSRPPQRSAFTLVELLVVITVIGILIGMLIIAIGPAMRRSREFVIETEMMQMNQAMEKFKVKYGFYPPDFSALKNIDDSNPTEVAAAVNAILPFINRIAPQHAELTLTGGAGSPRYIDNWWLAVGTNLDNESSLVFWLAGLSKSKQFPLTNPNTGLPLAAHAWNTSWNGGDNGIEREIFFDFKNPQLHEGIDSDPVGGYEQPRAEAHVPYLYFRYTPSMMNNALGNVEIANFDGYDNGVVPENLETFQLVSAGLDEQYGVVNGNWQNAGAAGGDNIVNFIADGSMGRLDRKILGLED